VQLLLDIGADVSIQNEDGCDALHYALKMGSEAAARLLLDHGADVRHEDHAGDTALIQACRENIVGNLPQSLRPAEPR